MESNGKLPHLFIPRKTATLVPEFAVEDVPLAELQPWCLSLQRKTCLLGRTPMIMMILLVKVMKAHGVVNAKVHIFTPRH